MLLCGYNSIQLKKPIRHERDAILKEIKDLMSKINLQRGKLTVENRKSREKKRICSEVTMEYLIVSGAEIKRSVAVRVLCVDIRAVELKIFQVLNTTAITHLPPTEC